MGSISFLLPNPMPPGLPTLLRSAFFASGYDQDPVPTRLELLDDRLVATWDLDESRYLCMPWTFDPSGTLLTTTATLIETPQPYRLMVELARGKLNQVRTQTAEWIGIGLRTPPGFDAALSESGRLFSTALCAAPAEADAAAARVLDQSQVLGDTLVREFVAQLLDTRHQDEGLLDTRLAARSPSGPAEPRGEYASAFNAAQVAVRWRDIEPEESRYDWSATDRAVAAAAEAGLPVTIGPLIDPTAGLIPDWVTAWQGDLPTLAAFMCDFTEAAIRRYRPRVRRWVVCAGFNHAHSLGLDDDERMRLALRMLETAAGIDSELELVLSVAQPWGDYRATGDHTISPITFPDDLMRTGLKLSAVELEFRMGTTPRGSRPRDLLDVWRVIQLFGGLGLPLEVVLSYPASERGDPLAVPGEKPWLVGWGAQPVADSQADWGTIAAALALSLPEVRAVTWDHWSDEEPHLVPTGGLFDDAGRPRALFSRLKGLRASHLRGFEKILE
ncbi:MAG TPA: hypothetical protein VM529_20295 [Gemmata sp.]|nr:hypothetical protein [Gemmata sp.]